MPRFAANLTMMFNEVPFPERFAAAARAGFTAVEFLFPYEYRPEDIGQWLRQSKLENVLFNLPPGNWAAGERGLAAQPGREDEFRAALARAIEYADQLGTPILHAMPGVVPSGADRRPYRETYVRNLKYAAGELAKRGLRLGIEPINTRDIPGYFLNTQAEAFALLEEVGAPNLFMQLDLYHAQIVEGDLEMKLRKYIKHVAHIQVASVPKRHEPDEGEVNYAYLFDVIDELGYTGWIGCEYRPKGRTEDGLGWFKIESDKLQGERVRR